MVFVMIGLRHGNAGGVSGGPPSSVEQQVYMYICTYVCSSVCTWVCVYVTMSVYTCNYVCVHEYTSGVYTCVNVLATILWAIVVVHNSDYTKLTHSTCYNN